MGWYRPMLLICGTAALPMSAKRPARTNFERGLLPLHPRFLQGFAVFCVLVSGLFAFISRQQLTKQPPALTVLDGTLHQASFGKYGLKLQLTGTPARFSVNFAPDQGALRRLFETRLRPGS